MTETLTQDPEIHEQQRLPLGESFLRKFFEAAAKYEASDLLLRGDQVPKLRLRGALKALETPAVPSAEFQEAISVALTHGQRELFEVNGSIDVGVDLDERTRFRVNIFRSRGRPAIAARRINNNIMTFEQLHLPAVLRKVTTAHQGLVLVSGVTGSGKSTTIATMLQMINESRPCHIVTVEDPIEYLFTDSKAIVSQREIGIDVPSFDIALRALVREDPDVVLIGEMRDKETFEAALQAAETGHLVFGTIHASSTSQAFGRIYDLFPVNERGAIRNLLAYQTQAFICQKLLVALDEQIARVPAVEVLLQSPPTRKFILEEREHELDEVIKSERESGMQTFADSLVELVEKEYIHPKVAQSAAASAQEIQMRLRGIKTE
ncbi:MAG: twitching motility protein PilT [Phycisphaeraceae bacterium]|nr:twitching motility protein PilT [Phycisphaeraceae bacterium]